jgi:flagellar M-ring protein FliF
VEPIGRIQRLDVAVFLDGSWVGEDEERVFTPLPDEEIARLRGIISTAAGLDTERGDQITVECVPFAASEAEPPPEFIDPLSDIRPYLPYIGYGIGFLFGIFLFVKVLLWSRRRRKQLAEDAERNAPPILAAPTSVRELERSMMRAQTSRDALAAEFGEEPEDHTATEIRALAAKMAADDPERAARVIRGWLSSDQAQQSQKSMEEMDACAALGPVAAAKQAMASR